MQIQTLKGFRDFLPAEAIKRNWLRNRIQTVFERWGYDPLETPTLEPLELFTGQIGEDEKLFFSFKDAGGRSVALRYDQTVPTVRVVAQYQNQLPRPFKRYQIQNSFRAEKPQKGRYREFTQCDGDIFGDPSPRADAETIALSLDIYKSLGFKDAQVLINDRNLLKDFPYEAIVSIDKIKKIGEDGVIAEMGYKGIDSEKAKEYLSRIKTLEPSESISIITKYLKDYGFDDSWYMFDPTIARSFSYSQGPIWEVFIPEYTAGSVLGGERYDGLFKSLFNIEMYGTGFGLGFDRTLEAAEQFGLIPTLQTTTQALAIPLGQSSFTDVLGLVRKMREQGINIETYGDPTAKIDKPLKYADKKGVPYVIILGEEEIKNSTVTVKNLKNREQETVSVDEAIQILTAE